MISELVAGSACTWPPVDGRADAATGVVDCADAPPAVPDVPEGAFGFCVTVVRPLSVGRPRRRPRRAPRRGARPRRAAGRARRARGRVRVLRDGGAAALGGAPPLPPAGP